MSSDAPIDIVVEILNSLAEKPKTIEDLTDKLWEELRSPVTTTPIVEEAITFLKQKRLVYKRKGLFRLTSEGRKIVNRELPSPTHVSHYEQLLEAGRKRRKVVLLEERLQLAEKQIKARAQARRARRAKDLEGARDLTMSI